MNKVKDFVETWKIFQASNKKMQYLSPMQHGSEAGRKNFRFQQERREILKEFTDILWAKLSDEDKEAVYKICRS